MQSFRNFMFCHPLVSRAIFIVALGLGGSAHIDCVQATEATSDSKLIEAGRYLATAGDCISCHTRQGGAAFAGGRPLDTPFGIIYSANITSDRATGIGAWTEQQFVRALQEGIAADGTHLYPAFPYTAYTKLTDGDAHAIYAFVRTLKPVNYVPPKNAMPFPFNVRASLALWNNIFFTPGRFVADISRSGQWNRGAYLTLALGHCSSCHSPRNVFGAQRTSEEFTGGVYLDEIVDAVSSDKVIPLDERTVRNWSAPNLTPASNGLGAWSADDITSYLKTGHNVRAGALGPMSTVITNSTSKLSDADARSIAVYLTELQPAGQNLSGTIDENLLKAGEIVYTARCTDCHQPTGLGMPRTATADPSKTAPPLAGNAVLQAPDPASLINIILYGAHESTAGSASWPKMSGFELSVGLDDDQIAALCTYVRSSWGNRAPACSAAQVAKQH